MNTPRDTNNFKVTKENILDIMLLLGALGLISHIAISTLPNFRGVSPSNRETILETQETIRLKCTGIQGTESMIRCNH